jgi:hypothetical protein
MVARSCGDEGYGWLQRQYTARAQESYAADGLPFAAQG